MSVAFTPPPVTERVVLGELDAEDPETFSEGRGTVRLWHLGHRIAVWESSGALTSAHARIIVRYFARHVESHPRPWYVVANWLPLKAYTADVRTSLTEWQLRMKYDELHVAQNSVLLRMSIGVANAVLPTEIKSVRTLEQLDSILSELRARHGL